MRFFPDGFRDETYLNWERDYKFHAHEQWEAELGPQYVRRTSPGGPLLRGGDSSRTHRSAPIFFSFSYAATCETSARVT